jgi:hypothetical protein
MTQHNSRNGDSGAVHSAKAVEDRQRAARREDANASTRPNQVTVTEVRARYGR